jgi:hypothetical protein
MNSRLKASSGLLTLILAVSSSASSARDLPYANLIANQLSTGSYASTLKGCKNAPFTAPRSGSPELECWAANTANELSKQPARVRSFVLNASTRAAVLSRCKSLTFDQKLKSEECLAAGHADTFIALRLPRMSLAPVEFK